jgi:uncharacterized membrane protein
MTIRTPADGPGGLRPPGRRSRPDLLIATLVAASVLLLGAAGLPVGPLRAAAGLFLVAFAPGAAFLAMLRPDPLSTVARTVLAIPVSLALATLAGIALDHTSWGVQPMSLAIALLGLTAVLFALGAARRGRLAPPQRVVDAGPLAEAKPVAGAGPLAGTGSLAEVGP